MTTHYNYTHKPTPIKVDLPDNANAGHGDHWAILTDDIGATVPTWLHTMLDNATLPTGLRPTQHTDDKLLLGGATPCHIKQILNIKDGKPTAFVNAYPAVDSPYGLHCQIEKIIHCNTTCDAILRLRTKDGTTIYAFDQLYTVNRHDYHSQTDYYANFSAWAYHIAPSDKDESLLIKSQKSIRHHRAFSEIVANHQGQVPPDIDEKIKIWLDEHKDDEPFAPVEINFGESCIYLFGETFGQEDEAWCQGQVLGKSYGDFFGQAITLFDVVILREHGAEPLVVRIATPTTADNEKIAVHDYIQANIWLQVAIYAQNQRSA